MRPPAWPFAVLFASTLAAQGPPTFVPAPHLARFVAEDVPSLRAQLPDSAIGKLLAEPETAAAFAAGLAKYRRLAAAQRSLLDAVVASPPPELEPWIVSQLPVQLGWRIVAGLDLADLQRAELLALATTEERSIPATVLTVACGPRAQGRWAAHFARHEKELATYSLLARDLEAKFAGFPVALWKPATPDGEAANEAQLAGLIPSSYWLLQLPGVFALGTDAPEACGTYAPAPARTSAQVLMEMDAQAYVAMFTRQMGGAPPEFRALGLDGLRTLRWRLRFADGLLRDEIELALADEPSGAIGAILTGKGALPAQALPDVALAQLRCTFDTNLLVTALEGMTGASMRDELRAALTKGLTGGIALGVSAPAKGSLIPRVFLSLGIADEAALDQALTMLVKDRVTTRTITYEDIECMVAQVPDAPAGFAPTWCRVAGVLHVAESGLSMRAFLKARAGGATAMDVGDAPIPAGDGEPLPNFDLRWDEGAIYSAFHANWLPLLKLVPGLFQQPLLDSAAMPSPDAVAPLLRKARGVLRRDGTTFTLQQAGALGGLHTGALAMLWGPLLSGLFHHDWMHDQVRTALAKGRLQAAWTALEAFREQHGRWPKDLAELITDRKLPADALLLPGDAAPEAVPMPDGRGDVRSSFRYFASPVAVNVNGTDHKLLLIAIAPSRYGRPMLGDSGAQPEAWGEPSTCPIDDFGK